MNFTEVPWGSVTGVTTGTESPPTTAPMSDLINPPPPVHIGVTVIISVLVGLLLVVVYIQLIMVLCFGYKLLSYQTILLFNILLWASLRLVLYSFYYYHCCTAVDTLSVPWEWLLVAFPAVLQYFSLAILVHYFGESYYRVLEKRQEMSSLTPPYRKMRKYRVVGWGVWLSSVLVFFIGNLVFTVLIELRKNEEKKTEFLEIMRVVLLDGLFLVMGITLGVCIIVIFRTRVGKDVLEAQNVHKCKPLIISFLLIALFVSRALYNFIALKVIKVEPYIATDMADNEFSTHYNYIVYFVVQVIWEVIPTYLIVFFFRVTFPSSTLKNLTSATRCSRPKTDTRKHFFDNPHRYDAETEDLLYGTTFQRSGSSTNQMAIPSLSSGIQATSARVGYGSTSKTHYSAPSKYSINGTPSGHSSYMPGTTPPPLFTKSPSFFSDH